MKALIIFFVLNVFYSVSYGQERLVGKGKNYDGVTVEYYLQESSIRSKGTIKEAKIRKFYPDENSSLFMTFDVDCQSNKYLITETIMGSSVITNGSKEMNIIVAGSPLLEVVNTICKE